jgi:ABC-type Na+ efflux pump permease subunit
MGERRGSTSPPTVKRDQSPVRPRPTHLSSLELSVASIQMNENVTSAGCSTNNAASSVGDTPFLLQIVMLALMLWIPLIQAVKLRVRLQ